MFIVRTEGALVGEWRCAGHTGEQQTCHRHGAGTSRCFQNVHLGLVVMIEILGIEYADLFLLLIWQQSYLHKYNNSNQLVI